MTNLKNAAISARIIAKIGEGLNVRQAIDAILGAGTSEKLAGELYEALRARKADWTPESARRRVGGTFGT